jgi:hypothetical protein
VHYTGGDANAPTMSLTLNLVGVHSPLLCSGILESCDVGHCPTSKTVSIPRLLAAGFLIQLSLTNVDDAAGRRQFEGGEVFQENRHIANYASTMRGVIQGTEAQNTAMLTMTLFFIGQPQQPTENLTLQGSHNVGSGEEIGSVSAASPAYSYIGKQFNRSGNTLVIQ